MPLDAQLARAGLVAYGHHGAQESDPFWLPSAASTLLHGESVSLRLKVNGLCQGTSAKRRAAARTSEGVPPKRRRKARLK